MEPSGPTSAGATAPPTSAPPSAPSSPPSGSGNSTAAPSDATTGQRIAAQPTTSERLAQSNSATPTSPIDQLKNEPTQAERLRGDDNHAADHASGAAAIANQQAARTARVPNADALQHEVHSQALSKIDSQTRTQRGPVLSGVGDAVTGAVHEGQNFNMKTAAGRAEYANFVENAHPVVKSRIEARDADVKSGRATPSPNDGTVGAHSEVVALDKAVKAREAATGVRVTEKDMGSFQLHNRSMLEKYPGTVMDRCSNCQAITQGVEVVGHEKSNQKTSTLERLAATKPDRPYAPIEPSSMPGAKQGGAMGAAASLVVSTGEALRDGKITAQEGKDIAKQTATGAVIGAVSAKAEQIVTSAIDRAIAQRGGTSASSLLGTSAGSRVLGSTAVGAAVSAGISVYENREGLAKGDSKAIGNVTADTVVGAAAVAGGSILGAAAAGAVAGSVVPGLGTAVGFAVGVGVGVAITYGAQSSGVRDAISNGTAAVVDGARDLASGAWNGIKSAFSW